MEEEKTKEYDVLGYKVRLAQKAGESVGVSADEVVGFVRDQAEQIQRKNPNLDRGQVAILVALRMASDKIAIDREFKESVHHFQATTQGVLEEIDQISAE